ncbi:hypothetical protein IFM89_026627 [Coptis chinensis]|uniref:Uncharacterized protein n=1 Tax=Coptis chinensis TaxID=261450 RepID=A0A835H941_9MAGN|nr:hypothetical protein IFM89_026627 [Coptis chinensis]
MRMGVWGGQDCLHDFMPKRSFFKLPHLLQTVLAHSKGLAYAMNTIKELKFVKEILAATGINLDPV